MGKHQSGTARGQLGDGFIFPPVTYETLGPLEIQIKVYYIHN
jgi:hypothetical protein